MSTGYVNYAEQIRRSNKIRKESKELTGLRKIVAKPTKTRTPADIGREIAEAKRRIVALNAELATVPPSVLEVSTRYGKATTLKQWDGDELSLKVAHDCDVLYKPDAIAKIRAWLNHYYPEA